MKKLLRWLSSSKKGNHISLWARKHVETVPVKQLLGINLAGLTFAVAVVIPQTNDIRSTWEVSRDVPQATIVAGPTESERQWPLTSFGVSQQFGVVHPGIDLTAPFGSPVYPVEAGTVSWTQSASVGYGNHLLIEHPDGLQSLIAHLSKITVTAGQTVDKTTKIGEVGATGWATGNHVHMEIYQDGAPTNPLEILPKLK